MRAPVIKKTLKYTIIVLLIFSGWAVGLFYVLHNENNSNEIVLYGNVDVRQVDIGFRIPGQVDEMLFEEGDFVAKGTLMTALNKSPYDSEVKKAFASVQSIKANYENAKILLNRREQLITVGGVSQEDLDDAFSNYNQLKADLAAANNTLQIAQDNLSYTEAYAPSDGYILSRIREPGSVVKESDPVYTLSIIDPVWIRAYIDEPQLGLIYYGMEAEIFTDTIGGKAYKGKIGFISPIAEFTPKTVQTTQLRTDLVYRLRIYVDNADKFLKQGMPVTVKLKREI